MRVGLAIADGKIVNMVVVDSTDNALMHHLLEVIGQGIVMTGVVILG